jgi:hypothetical protein
MNKYLETLIKAAIKAGRDNMREVILYRNYMITTDGHRLHAVATEADYGNTPKQVSGKDAPPIDQIWKEATPTHELQMSKHAIKALKGLVDAISACAKNEAGLTVHFVGEEVFFSRKGSNEKTGRKDGLDVSYRVNNHPIQRELKFVINGHYLLDLLKETDSWTLSQEKEGAPLWFEAGDRKACIMPMREE